MATASVATTSPAQGFQPAFKRVAQSNDFDCAFACIAMIVNRPLDEVRKVAIERFKHPKHGPYVYMNDELIAKLFAHWSFRSTAYIETNGVASLPDVAIGLVDYDSESDVGRHVVFVRQPGATGKPSVEYIIDPAYWIEPNKQVRLEKGSSISWHIGVVPQKAEGK